MKLTTDDRKALQGAMNVLAEILQQASPEAPERIEEWPEDDTHLRGDFWKCSWGSVISYRGDGWYWWDHRNHCWHPENHPGESSSMTRTTDPSIPRTWDSLDAVDADVDRAIGDDAIERMARAILQKAYGGNVDLLSCDAWGVARGDARAALAALLGTDKDERRKHV